MQDHSHENSTEHSSKLEERVVFFFVVVGVIAITYGVLYLADFLPEAPKNEPAVEENVAPEAEKPAVPVSVDPLPKTIIFDTLNNKELVIANPETRDVTELNAIIHDAVARHPDSADFKDVGTIFLFAHSTYLPNITNPYFKAFNDIQKLEWGDTIRLRSSDYEYVYSVDRVYEVRATEAEIAIERGVGKLTLSTCNTFGAKDDRFVVEATLISSKPLEKVAG